MIWPPLKSVCFPRKSNVAFAATPYPHGETFYRRFTAVRTGMFSFLSYVHLGKFCPGFSSVACTESFRWHKCKWGCPDFRSLSVEDGVDKGRSPLFSNRGSMVSCNRPKPLVIMLKSTECSFQATLQPHGLFINISLKSS